MLRVIERREQKLRLERAALAREIAATRDGLAALEETIAAVERRASANAHSRFATGARSIAELLEIEQNSSSLRAGRADLEAMRARLQETLARLSDRQRALANKWRKEVVRLGHVTAIVRRSRVLADVRRCEADDEDRAPSWIA
jgi:outer membrane protein TolC